MEDRWFGNAFQIFGATDENDLEAAMVILRGGTHIEKDEEERSARTGTYLRMRDFVMCSMLCAMSTVQGFSMFVRNVLSFRVFLFNYKLQRFALKFTVF